MLRNCSNQEESEETRGIKDPEWNPGREKGH
jgi:hypothetical protein